MPLVPIGYVEGWVRFTLEGDPEPMWTCLAYHVESPPFTATNADFLITGMIGTMKTKVSHNFVLSGGQARVGNDGGDILYDVAYDANGSDPGESVPNNSAMLVRKSTALGGRRGRGRMFIPGPVRDQITATGGMSSSYRGGWQTAINGLLDFATLDANVDAAVLLHQSEPYAPTPIVNLTVEPKIASQRRRMR